MNEAVERENTRRGLWNGVIAWAVENRLVAFLLAAVLAVAGVGVAPFAWDGLGLPRDPVPVDAIPDIGANQQIVFTEWAGRSPRDVEDQITYPLTTALLGIAGVRTVRSTSAFGFSTIYVLFDDDVEFYWSRSRVLEKLASLPASAVPDGVSPTLGPDATALGQVFWYTLEGQDPMGRTVGGWDPDELRSVQDWTVRYALQSAPGVSEVASVGGFVREYQVDVDPEAMRAHGVRLAEVADAVRHSNLDVGARTLELNRVEYIVRGVGFVESLGDLEGTVVATRDHTPIRIRDIGRVSVGPALRRGALDDEGAPAVGGVVVARYRANPVAVIAAVKEKIAQIQPGLPSRTLDDGTVSQVTIVPFYDRTTLIDETLGTLSTALYQQILITILVMLILLRNLRSSALMALLLPLGVLGAFVVMKATGVDANVMALAGVAIAIGTMVDIGIVFLENIGRQLERYDALGDARGKDNTTNGSERVQVVRRAAAEVAPAVMTSVLTTVVSFLPIFGLSEAELRLFAPLALTKTFAMLVAFGLAVLVIPGASLLVFARRRAPSARATWRAFLHRSTARDWILVLAGAWLGRVHAFSGAFVLAFGAYRIVRRALPIAHEVRLRRIERIFAVVAVALLLTEHWRPLRAHGLPMNALFVGVMLLVTLGGFRTFESAYPQLLKYVLQRKKRFAVLPVGIVLFGAAAWLGVDARFLPDEARAAVNDAFPGLGREYMPAFDEGSFLYMPTTMPHASIGEVLDALSEMDAAIAQIPEVDRVVGKLGRVESALDPAPVSMIETMITYKPEYVVNDDGERIRQWRDRIRTPDDIWREIARVAERPGLTGAPTLMPINARLAMLHSGMRAPMGIKVRGPSLELVEEFGMALEALLKNLPFLRPETVFADRVVGKPYLEVHIDREAIGRHGLSVVDVQSVLEVALGGAALGQMVEGRARYPIRVRYMREERDSLEALERILVPMANGESIPLTELADIRYARGPQMIRSEDTFLTSYVLFDRAGEIAEVDAVEDARRAIEGAIERGELVVPTGVSFEFAGTYQNQVRSERRLSVLVPIALLAVFALLYLQFRRVSTSLIIFSGVAVSVAGGFVLLWLYGQPWFLNADAFGVPLRELFHVRAVSMSVAVWIGFIALIGIATDDGVVMSTFLRARFSAKPPRSVDDVRTGTLEAATRRVRPCLMTTATTLLALLPVITSTGRGADLMGPMALPLVGGMAVALLTLFAVPVLHCAVEERALRVTQNE
ncbi:MAG: efflux RND transporter permease subunit [Myxococcota bacterium]